MEAARSRTKKKRTDDVWFPGNMEFHSDVQGGPQVEQMRYENPKWDFPDLWGCYQTSYLPHQGNVQNMATYSTADADTYDIHRRITSSFLGTFSTINTKDVAAEPIGIHPSSKSLYDVDPLISSFYGSDQVKSDTFFSTTKTYPSDCNDKDPGVGPLEDNGKETVDVYNANGNSVSIPEGSQSPIYADYSIRNKAFERYTASKFDFDHKNAGAYSLVDKGNELIDKYHISEQLVSNPENSQDSITNETFEQPTLKQYDSDKDDGTNSLIENGDKLVDEFHVNEKSVTNLEGSQYSTYADISITSETFEQPTLKQYGSDKDNGTNSLIENGDKLVDEFHVNEKSVTNLEDSQCSTYNDISITSETFEQSTLKQYGSDEDDGAYSLIENGDKLVDKHRVNGKSFTNSEDILSCTSVDVSYRNRAFKQSTLNSEISRLDSEPESFDLTRQSDRYLVSDKSLSNPEDSLCSTSSDLSNEHEKINQSTLNPVNLILDSAPQKLDLTRPVYANCDENSCSSESVESYTEDGSNATLPKPVLAPKLPVSTDSYHPQLRSPADIPPKKQPKKASHNKECTICGKRYPTYYKLNDHMNAHKNYRPHKCDCGKTFVRKSSYHRHQKVHRKYVTCCLCKEKFLLPVMLGKHKSDCPMADRQHSPLRPHRQPLFRRNTNTRQRWKV